MPGSFPTLPTAVIVRFSEITLKGRNRRQFERRMRENIALHLRPLGAYRVEGKHLSVEIGPAGEGEADLVTAAEVVRGLPGVANISLVRRVPSEPAALAAAVGDLVGELLAGEAPGEQRTPTFRVAVNRRDKRYPTPSMALAAELGRAVLERFPHLHVNLTAPDITVLVDIVPEGALLAERRLPGPGGLAVGSSAPALCLLSAGIDSPVAAYLMMTRGCPIAYLNFHSFPFIGEQSKEKARDIVRFLARYQPRSRLHVAPFAEIQRAIRDLCPEGLRTVLYRRMMNRVANHVARRERALALVTGESVGQVASQTMENLAVIHRVAELPVLQPLIGLTKHEIVQRARAIGTYPISIQPFPDCCTLFQPRHPETHARLERVEAAEACLPVDDLVAACLAGIETSDYGPEYYPARW